MAIQEVYIDAHITPKSLKVRQQRAQRNHHTSKFLIIQTSDSCAFFLISDIELQNQDLSLNCEFVGRQI